MNRGDSWRLSLCGGIGSGLGIGQSAASIQIGPRQNRRNFPLLPSKSADRGWSMTSPAEFRFAVYERLIERVRQDGTFQKVFRSGDHAAANVRDLVILRTKVGKFNEGSQFRRELTTVTGGTTVDVTTTVGIRDGRVLLESDLSGKVRFFGENLGVTNDLAKRIAKLLKESF